MSVSVPIHLPVFQRFDCNSCTYCCRNPVVNVNDADRKRILAAGWQERMNGQPMWVEYRFGGRRLYRLDRREDGTCVFLGPDNLCRIHSESGPATKPLACRMFPFVIVPGVDGVHVDLRMDCPSAAANHGRTLSAHAMEIGRLAAESQITKGLPRVPAWGTERELASTEFGAVVAAFEGILRKRSMPARVQLHAGCRLLDLMYAARIHKVRNERFVELMDLLATAAIEEADADGKADADSSDGSGDDVRRPLNERAGRLFRQWLFLHTTADDPESLSAGRIRRLRNSWRRYGYARRFAAGRGEVPPVQANWPGVTFEAIGAVRPAPDEALEPLIRAMRLKLDAHAFAGPAYFGYDLLAGLTALWLLPGVVGWLARLEAVREQRPALTAGDVLAGVREAHHTFGVSPVFSRVSEKLRMRGLARPGVPAALLDRYGP